MKMTLFVIFGIPINPWENILSVTFSQICVKEPVAQSGTRHIFCAPLLFSPGFETREIMFMSGHRNKSSVRSYSRYFTTKQKQTMSSVLSVAASGKCTTVAIPSIPETDEGQSLLTTSFNINPMQRDVRNTTAAIKSGVLSNSIFKNCTLHLNMKM